MNFVDKPEQPLNLRTLVNCMIKQNIDVIYLNEYEFMVSGQLLRIYNGCLQGENWKHKYFNHAGILNILHYQKILNISTGCKNAIIYDYQIEIL